MCSNIYENETNMKIKTYHLINEAFPPFFGISVMMGTGLHTGFTSIDVDAQVTNPDGSKFDVIFVGTSKRSTAQGLLFLHRVRSQPELLFSRRLNLLYISNSFQSVLQKQWMNWQLFRRFFWICWRYWISSLL